LADGINLESASGVSPSLANQFRHLYSGEHSQIGIVAVRHKYKLTTIVVRVVFQNAKVYQLPKFSTWSMLRVLA
jgi:hypothetical protein